MKLFRKVLARIARALKAEVLVGSGYYATEYQRGPSCGPARRRLRALAR